MEVVDEILQSDFGSRPDPTNRSYELAAHRYHLMAKDMFDASPHAASTLIRLLLFGGQGPVSIPFVLNLQAELLLLELAFNLLRPIGRITPHIPPRGLGL